MNRSVVIPAPEPESCQGDDVQVSRWRGNDSVSVIPATEPEYCQGDEVQVSRLRGNDSVIVIPATEPESITNRFIYHGSRVKPGMTELCGGMTELCGGMTELRGGMTELCGEMTKRRGFTLLEVMIALLVITLGMGAVINTTSESGWKSAQLKQGTIANWVAQNQIAHYRARRTWSNATTRSGEVEMANVEWAWKMKISKTDDPSLRRLDVDVFLKGEDVLKASVTGFIARL